MINSTKHRSKHLFPPVSSSSQKKLKGSHVVPQDACSNLATHNSDTSRRRANHCPRCNWFDRNWNNWPEWDGISAVLMGARLPRSLVGRFRGFGSTKIHSSHENSANKLGLNQPMKIKHQKLNMNRSANGFEKDLPDVRPPSASAPRCLWTSLNRPSVQQRSC